MTLSTMGPRLSAVTSRELEAEAEAASDAASRRGILRGGDADRDESLVLDAAATVPNTCGWAGSALNALDVWGSVSRVNTSIVPCKYGGVQAVGFRPRARPTIVDGGEIGQRGRRVNRARRCVIGPCNARFGNCRRSPTWSSVRSHLMPSSVRYGMRRQCLKRWV